MSTMNSRIFDSTIHLRPPKIGDKKHQLVLSVANVLSTTVINGRLYASVDDLDNGQRHDRCPVMCFGGGTDKFMFVPVTPTPQDGESLKMNEAVIVHRGEGKPYIIGTKQPLGFGIKKEIAEDPGEADHSGDVAKDDFAIQNSSAKFIVDANGAVTIKAGTAKHVRIQLDETEGALRVSRGGEADECVILANAFIDTFINQTLYAHLVAQNARIAALEAQVATLSTILTSGIAVTGTTSDAKAVTGTTVPPSGLSTFSPPSGTSVPSAGEQYKSDTIRLASKAKG